MSADALITCQDIRPCATEDRQLHNVTLGWEVGGELKSSSVLFFNHKERSHVMGR